jgi:integrase
LARILGHLVGKRAKTFVVKIHNRRITIGRYHPAALPLAEARKRALVVLGSSHHKSASVSFAAALAQFFDVHVPSLKPRTQKEIRRVLNRHCLSLKTKKLDQITHRDISAITDALIETPSEAWHCFKDIRTFFKWCVPRYIPHSPCEGLKPPTKYLPRKRVLTDTEIGAVWNAAGEVGYPFGTILQLLILTGQRWSEIASLRWPYINKKGRTITLPDTKNREEHTFPYGGMVTAILKTIPHRNSTDLLFPGRNDEKPWNGAGKAKWDFNKKCLLDAWQILDLRRTAATKWAENGAPPHIVERLLNHKLGSLKTEGVITAVAQVYNRHLYIDEMREKAIKPWEARLKALINGRT